MKIPLLRRYLWIFRVFEISENPDDVNIVECSSILGNSLIGWFVLIDARCPVPLGFDSEENDAYLSMDDYQNRISLLYDV